MQRIDAIQTVLGRRSWRLDYSTEAAADVNREVNNALSKLAGDCPGALEPVHWRSQVLRDEDQETMGRGIAVTADPYVLTLGPANIGGFVDPKVDGTWDGVYEIESVDADGVVHRRQCREWWYEIPAGELGPAKFFVSLDRPWYNATDSDKDFRLHQKFIWFPADTTEVRDAQLELEGSESMDVTSEPVLWAQGGQDYRGSGAGQPDTLVRGPRYILEGPKRAPDLRALDNVLWDGPDPPGTFRAYYTFCWGKRTGDFADPRGVGEPVWESAPSPVSAAVAVTKTEQLKISGMLNIDHMLGFYDAASMPLRHTHSGVYKRIYIVRDATDIDHPTAVREVEAGGFPVLLTEVAGDENEYTWEGDPIPVYDRRLVRSTGYYGFSYAAHQGSSYIANFRLRRKPQPLENDYDVVPIQETAVETFLVLLESYICKLDAQKEDAALLYAQYETVELPKFNAALAAPSQVLPPGTWRGSATPGGRYRWWRPGNLMTS